MVKIAENAIKKNEFTFLQRGCYRILGMQKGFVNSAFLKKRLFGFQTPMSPPVEGAVDASVELEHLRQWVRIVCLGMSAQGVENHFKVAMAAELDELGFTCTLPAAP